MRDLYVVRHGQTVWNGEQRLQGRLDSALTETGQEQATINGKCLRELGGVDRMFVSPLGRTRETAYLMNSHLRVAIDFEDALMERDCGDWTGLSLDELEARFPSGWAEREKDPYHHRPPGGENLPDMLDRARPFLDTLFEVPHERVALVTHGIMSRVILTYFLGLSPIETGRLRHPNELVYRLTFGSTEIVADHFLAGVGPTSGLLHRDHGGTIVRPESEDSGGS